MFGSLRKKLSGWLGISEEKAKKKSKTKKTRVKKESKSAKKTSQKKRKRTKKEISEERNISEQVIEDIKKENKNEISDAVLQIEQEAEDKPEIKEEPKGFFSKLFKKVTNSLSSYKITQEDFNEDFEELEITLLENNVALSVIDKIRSELSKSLIDKEVKKSDLSNLILSSLKEAILSVLIEPPNLIETIKSSKEPYVILFFGINGSGKTTSIAKLAHILKKNKISVVLAAGDTFRAASIEQLQTHANKLQVPVISSSYGSDPASVAFDAISYAKKNKIQCVLIDTAGRMYTKSNLLKEMEKIIRISKPNLKIFVGESITGNDATEQARTFNETCGIDGIILSKADIDEKAGTILSVSYVTGKPIYFLGTGQSYDDLTPFTKKTILKNLGLD